MGGSGAFGKRMFSEKLLEGAQDAPAADDEDEFEEPEDEEIETGPSRTLLSNASPPPMIECPSLLGLGEVPLPRLKNQVLGRGTVGADLAALPPINAPPQLSVP